MTLQPLRPLRPVDDGNPYLAISGTIADVERALADHNIRAHRGRHAGAWSSRCPACRRNGALSLHEAPGGVAAYCRARCAHADVLAALQGAPALPGFES